MIKPTHDADKVGIRIKITKVLEAEIASYMEWAKIKKIDSFLQQAADYILTNDKDWRSHKKQQAGRELQKQ